jgi:hypothetical protein
MKSVNCTQEELVTQSARSGEWPDGLRSHVAGCAVCEDIVRASRWMQAMATADMDLDSRDAGLLWWRAQLGERRAQAERVHNALEWIEIASLAIVAAGFWGWAARNWQLFGDAADWFWTALSLQNWSAAYSIANSFVVSSWPIVTVLSFLLLCVAYPILAED